MEKISEPRVILREGREDTVLDWKVREPLIALLSDGTSPLYAFIMAKNESLIKKFLNIGVLRFKESEREGILQRETDGKNASICAGISGDS